jgi:predicted nucleic acid-binding protein
MATVAKALARVSRLGLDAGPVIHYGERNALFNVSRAVFAAVNAGNVQAAFSFVLVSEVLVYPLQDGDTERAGRYYNLLFSTKGIEGFPVTLEIAERAAKLRAAYNLQTPDALHIATAIETGCDAFLTTEGGLSRITEIPVLVLSHLTP